MAVKKRTSIDLKNFIEKGAEVKSACPATFKNVLIRIPTSVLNQLDMGISKTPWVKRTQWIIEAIHQKIKSDFADEKEKNT